MTAPQLMTGSASHLAPKRRNHRAGLVLIAAYKLLGALLFIAVGVGALRLLHKDIDDVVWRMIGDLKMNPESRIVNFLFEKAEIQKTDFRDGLFLADTGLPTRSS